MTPALSTLFSLCLWLFVPLPVVKGMLHGDHSSRLHVSLMAKDKAKGEEPSTYAALSRKQGFENMPINYPTLSLQNVEPRPPHLDVGQT